MTATPIALGERLFSRWDFKPFFEAGAVDIIQPDLSHAGGILEVRKIAAMAEAYDVALAPHCPLGPLALGACLQIAACTPNHAIQEISLGIHYNTGGHDLLNFCTNKAALTPVDGYLPVPEGPGLGVEIDEAAVREADKDRHSWRNPICSAPATAASPSGERSISDSVAFEAVERLQAGFAAPLRLARGRAEAADFLGVGRAALRAFGGCRRVRRSDAVGLEPLPAALGDPVGGPGREEHAFDPDRIEARLVEGFANRRFDRDRRRAAGIGRGDQHSRRVVATPRTMPRSVIDRTGISGSGTVIEDGEDRGLVHGSHPLQRQRDSLADADAHGRERELAAGALQLLGRRSAPGGRPTCRADGRARWRRRWGSPAASSSASPSSRSTASPCAAKASLSSITSKSVERAGQGASSSFCARRRRADAHDARRYAGDRGAEDARLRRQAVALRGLFARR